MAQDSSLEGRVRSVKLSRANSTVGKAIGIVALLEVRKLALSYVNQTLIKIDISRILECRTAE